MYRVGFRSANLRRTLSVIAALAASVVVLAATMSPAQATFPGKNGKMSLLTPFTTFLTKE
jgi:hypothetical protein